MERLFILFIFAVFPPIILLGQEQGRRELTCTEKEALKAANTQLEAYNNRDLDAFMDAYADDVKIYTFPGTLRYEGKEAMREAYKPLFERTPMLHCSIVSEIVRGNKVVHEESVVFDDPDAPRHAVCVYIVENGKITAAYFL